MDKFTRLQAVVVCLAIVALTPPLLVLFSLQSLFGDKDRAKNVAIAFDELGNAQFFYGDKDETISSRVGRGQLRGDAKYRFFARCIDWLFWDGHCADAAIAYMHKYERDIYGRDLSEAKDAV